MKKFSLLIIIALMGNSMFSQCAVPTLTATVLSDTSIQVAWENPDMVIYSFVEARAFKTVSYDPNQPTSANNDGYASANDMVSGVFTYSSLTAGTEYTFAFRYNCTTEPLQNTTVVAMTTGTPPPPSTDAYTIQVPSSINQVANYEVPITYTSDLEIAPGGIRFDMWSITERSFSQQLIATYSNTTTLPAGEDLTTTIPLADLPAIYTIDNTIGGIILADNQLADNNPNGATVDANFIAYFRLNPKLGTDSNFTPINLPGQVFMDVLEDPLLSVNDFNRTPISNILASNPVSNVLTLTRPIETKEFSIVNLSGQVVKTIQTESLQLNIQGLSSGIHFLLSDEGYVKFVVK